jgi:hypothetical protein
MNLQPFSALTAKSMQAVLRDEVASSRESAAMFDAVTIDAMFFIYSGFGKHDSG